MHEKDPIFRSLAMIEDKLREKLTVEMLAEGIHFSKYHYQRIFREAVGEPVMGYVNRRRLSLAAEELAGTRDSVLSIALRYGYDSHEGFTRSFKAYFGVTPTEYRKYHSSLGFPDRKHSSGKPFPERTHRRGGTEPEKEERAMTNSKAVNEAVRELNSLIVQAKEIAEATRKHRGSCGKGSAAYAQVWEFAAARAEKIAGQLEKVLEHVTSAAQNPDEISARFLIVKAVEDAAFEASVTSFQVGLTISRAMPEHFAAFRPLCAEYESLAQNARIKSGKIVVLLNELWKLILEDMRKEAGQQIRDAVDAGRAAAGKLTDPSLPYGYIAEAVLGMAEELAALPLEDVTVCGLEDTLLRLDTVLFAADIDILRAPQHRQLFDGISKFREKLAGTAEFFRNLPGEAAGILSAGTDSTLAEKAVGTSAGITDSGIRHTAGKLYRDLAMQEEILLFYLKGEIQKLGSARPDEKQQTALSAVCEKMERAVKMARSLDCGGERCPAAQQAPGRTGTALDAKEETKIAELLREAYEEMAAEAERLGRYGGAIRYLAEEVKKPLGIVRDFM